MQCPLKSAPQWQSNVRAFGEPVTYENYIARNGELPYSQTVKSNLASREVVEALLINLRNRFNIKAYLVSADEINDRAGLPRGTFTQGLFTRDGVFLNQENLSVEAAFHEYAHPLIEYIDYTTPGAIDNMFREVENDAYGKLVIRDIINTPGYAQYGEVKDGKLSSEGRKEAIVTLIGRLAQQEFGVAFSDQLEMGKSLKDKLVKFIEDVWEQVTKMMHLDYLVTPKMFSAKTTIGEVASLLALTETSLDMSGVERTNRKRALTATQMTKHSQMFDSIRVFLAEQQRHLERSHTKNKSEQRRKLNRFIEEFEQQSDKFKQFSTLIDFAYDQLVGPEGYLNKTEEVIAKIKAGSKLDAHETLKSLIDFRNFSADYSRLFEDIREIIRNDVGYAKFEGEAFQPGSPMNKVVQILNAAKYIQDAQQAHMNAALATVLFPYYSANAGSSAMAEIDQRLVNLRSRKGAIEKESLKKGVKPEKNSVYRSVVREIEKYETQKKRLDPSWETLVAHVTELTQDIDGWDYWTNPAKLSSDPVLATFANLLKSKFEMMRIKLLGIQRSARAELEKYRNATGLKMDFADSFYKGIYEEVTEYEKGNLVKTLAFVSEIDVTKYNEAYKEMKDEVWQLKTSGRGDLARKVETDFYSDNKIALSHSEIDTILADMENKVTQGIMSREELHDFVVKSMYHEGIQKEVDALYDHGVISYNEKYKMLYDKLIHAHNNRNALINYRYSLSKINPKKFTNPNWVALQQNPARAAFHKFLLDTYLDAQELLPPSKRRGHTLPQVRKRGWDRLASGEVWDFLKEEGADLVSFVENDEEIFGNQAVQTKSDKKYVPIYYTDLLAPEDLSVNLVDTVLRFTKMANKFSEVDQISEVTSAMEAVIENRPVNLTNNRGQTLFRTVASSMGIKTPNNKIGKEAKANQAIEAFIDAQVYGEHQKYETKTIFGKEVNVGKLANSLAAWVSRATIGSDFLKSVANMSQAKIMQFIEVGAGEFVDAKSFIKGEQVYYGEVIPDITSDFGKGVPQSFWGQMIEAFDPLQGDWENGFGEQISRSKLLRTMSWDAHFFGMHAGEHYGQVTMLLGMMEKEMIEADGVKIPLIKAYERGVNGKPTLRKGVDPEWAIGGKKMVAFTGKVHAVNNRLHGVYNSFDAPTAQQFAIGRMLILFRKFAPPGIARRYKRFGVNHQTGTFDEGFYLTFFNALLDQRSALFNYLTFGMVGSNGDQLTDKQKENINRMIVEINMFALTGVAAMFAAGYDDGDEDNYWGRFAEYEFTRLNSELGFYFNPRDFFRILKSPSASTTKVEQLFKFADLMFATWDPEKLEYQRDTGMWEKGDSKTFASFVKLLGITGYNLHPEEAVKGFKMSQN